MKIIFLYGLFFVFLAIAPKTLWAQQELLEKTMAPVSTTYAITNATIIQSPGRTLLNGTVVLKDGIILSAGKNISVPPDAIIIKGDSLFVYAGFIDGLSHSGVIKPKEVKNSERPKDPGNPTPKVAGITPENDVRNSLNPDEKSVDELRALGFTTAHAVPYGGMLPGYGAIIQLKGKTADDMVVVGRSCLFSQLTGAPRVYPATLLGVMAKWRELYRQSIQSKDYEVLYAGNRNGLSRPASDRILEAFYPVIDKRIPVLFEAHTFLDVQRILSLQADLGFLLMIGDLKEGWDAIGKLKSAGTKVFLSLHLPEEIAGEKKKDSLSAQSEKEDNPGMSTQETARLEQRRAAFMALYVGQASAFQKAGLIFGFSSFSARPKDIRTNLRRMIASGLTEDQALAALTTHPAQLLGLSDRMGAVEPGKIANLVISDKPYFQDKSKVRYVFVEGTPYQYDPKDIPTPEAPHVLNIAGTWTVTLQSPQGMKEEKVTIVHDGANFSGSVTGGVLEKAAVLEGIILNGDRLTYHYTVEAGGQSYKVDVQATVQGDTFKGTATRGNSGDFPLEAKRDPDH